jgi:hypothetical protein
MTAETTGYSLVDVYLALKRATAGASSDEADATLDDLYRRIVAAPVRDLRSAGDKLRFAVHCLDEEHDIKEAAKLIEEVATACEHLREPRADH